MNCRLQYSAISIASASEVNWFAIFGNSLLPTWSDAFFNASVLSPLGSNFLCHTFESMISYLTCRLSKTMSVASKALHAEMDGSNRLGFFRGRSRYTEAVPDIQ
ncbi:MAG: hypothetical protein Q8940_07260 [Bacteroidota bacterium]|nr:hypothetical protein [Bacteroidota bacterium]